MSDVSIFKAQQAAQLATDGPGGGAVLDGGGKTGGRAGGGSDRQPALIGAVRSEYQDGVAARALLQQWQARQQGSKGGMPSSFTPTQVCYDRM